MNETKYLWITNIPSKCKEEDVSRVLRRHGDIKTTKTVHHNSCFNLIVEYLDRSSAARAVRSQNLLKGSTLKVDYCDSLGNPWISSSHRNSSPITPVSQSFVRKSSDTMLVDRAGPSSGASGHHHHHSHHHNPHHHPQAPQSTPQHHGQRFQSPLSSSTSSTRPQSGPPSSSSLKVIFTPPPKYAETQIKQALCHELHKFGKTYHVNLLPASVTGGRQTRVALVVFRRSEDEERAFIAFRSDGRGLFGAPVHAEFCLGTDLEATGSSPRIRPSLAPSNVPIHSSPSISTAPLNSSTNAVSQQRTGRNPTFNLPTRSLVVHGLTAGPNGPVSEMQLNTAFQRFGAILHVQMRPASSSAVIEFVELRGSTRAMTTHQRDPLRLGGRPLRLFYTPSRPINCLFINDLPASLAYQSEVDLKTLFGRVTPLTQVLKITRSQEASANHSTAVHTCALLELASHESATLLLEYLRSPDSPLVLAARNRSSPEPLTTPRLPTFVCSVDYASPRQMEKITTPLKYVLSFRESSRTFVVLATNPPRFRCVESGRLRPPQLVTTQPPPPSSLFSVNDKSRGSVIRTKDHLRQESSEEGHSQSSSTTTSSPSPSKRYTETFPSQRRGVGVSEAPLNFPQKRMHSDPGKKEVARNYLEESSTFESMYDKIKRRAEGEKERQKRASPEIDEALESRLVSKKKKRRKHYENHDNVYGESRSEDMDEAEDDILKVKQKVKHADSPSSRRQSKNIGSHQRLKNLSSRSSVESHRQKSRTAQPTTKPVSTTITRLSLGMSVPMTASYHTIAKTPRRMSRLSSESSSSTVSRSRSPPSGDVDVKHIAPCRRASDRGTLPSSFLGINNKNATAGEAAATVSRSLSLNDVESASNCSDHSSSLIQKRPKRQKEYIKPTTPSPNVFNKSGKRKLSAHSPDIFKSSGASSSCLSSEDEDGKDLRVSRWSNPKSRFANLANINSGKRHKSRTSKNIKSKSKRAQSPVESFSRSSSRSASSVDSALKMRGSMDNVVGINASTPLSSASRLAKPTPPSRASDFHTALSDPDNDDADSLDDFDRFSANTAMTPSTEAMEISPETGDEEPEHSVSEWFSRMSDNHSESELDPDKEFEEESVDNRSEDQKPLLINFEDLSLLNSSKEDSLNLSNRDAIGDIKMEDQPSPRFNESSEKSKSTVGENSDAKPPEVSSSDEMSVSAPLPAFKLQLPATSPKLDPGTLPPPPPPPPNVQQISSPYSSSSPSQSLCSACSRSSPSPIIAAPLFASRVGMTTNTVAETTTVRITTSLNQESNKSMHPGLSENRDLKRYVQSVIERVKAETVDDANSSHRSANTTTANTPLTSPLHHIPTASPPHNPPPPPLSLALSQNGRKGASPGSVNTRRTSGATPPSLISTSSSSPTTRRMFESSNVPSIPGVNACAPLLTDHLPTSPNSKLPPVQQNHETVEPKTLRSTTRRRAKAATAGSTASMEVEKPPPPPPKQPTDPYEPNFDDDSPPLVKSGANSESPLVVNTSLTAEHPGPTSTVPSATTNEEGPPVAMSGEGSKVTASSSNRKSVLDSVDETIADVCSGRFDMKSYLDSWGLQPPTTAHVPPPNPAPISASSVVTTSIVTTTAATAVVKPPDSSKPPVASAATNNPIVTAIINALQSITGSPVLIGSSGSNSAARAVKQANSGVGQPLSSKASTMVVGSSPPTISATTITFPVIIKNFPAASTSTKIVPPPMIKSSVANSHSITMTTGSTGISQQMLHQQGNTAPTVAMSRPQSSSSTATDTAADSSHLYRMRRRSGNNIGLPVTSTPIDDVSSQRPLFNPRSFTSPPPPPRYHQPQPPQFGSPPPSRHIPAPPPWAVGGPMPPFPRPTRQETGSNPPSSAYSSPAALWEKLSCLIDHPDLVLPMLQTMMQEGQHVDPEWLASVLKMFQQYSVGNGADSGLPGSTNSSSTLSQSGAPMATSGSGGPSNGGQYSNHPRSGGGSTPPPPPVPRFGSFDQTYPLVWQGRLSLKNSEVSVALHYVQGNTDLLRAVISTLAAGGGGTPQQALITSGGPLRIVQRMRLEASQLDAVQRKIGQEGAACACVAFASGANRADLAQQNVMLEEGFIRYMLEKGAAGIINVGQPGSVQGLYVVHIFPPCDFSHAILRIAAPDLHQSIISAQLPHLLIVITTV
ncbi:hypothetical protein Aperf_G00000024958 [Anoplocephala perfoliata]